jgi:hypothetical protein
MAPQRLEKIEYRLENGSMSGASDPQAMVHGTQLTVRVSG